MDDETRYPYSLWHDFGCGTAKTHGGRVFVIPQYHHYPCGKDTLRDAKMNEHITPEINEKK